MSIWKWLIYATLFAINISVIIATWISPDPPTKISLTIWVSASAIWMINGLINDVERGNK
jgi:hypothetical protein